MDFLKAAYLDSSLWCIDVYFENNIYVSASFINPYLISTGYEIFAVIEIINYFTNSDRSLVMNPLFTEDSKPYVVKQLPRINICLFHVMVFTYTGCIFSKKIGLHHTVHLLHIHFQPMFPTSDSVNALKITRFNTKRLFLSVSSKIFIYETYFFGWSSHTE